MDIANDLARVFQCVQSIKWGAMVSAPQSYGKHLELDRGSFRPECLSCGESNSRIIAFVEDRRV